MFGKRTRALPPGVFMNAKKRKSFERKTVFEEGIEAAKIEAAKR
jgi:hypothetical protein